jgi:hypothetical protein
MRESPNRSAALPRIPTSASLLAGPITAAVHAAPALTGPATAATASPAGRSPTTACQAVTTRSSRPIVSTFWSRAAAKPSSRPWARSSAPAAMRTSVSRVASVYPRQARS